MDPPLAATGSGRDRLRRNPRDSRLVVRERRAADPIVPLTMLRTRTVAVASAALFLGTAALFSVTVFVPLFLQTMTGASPTEAGLLVPVMLGNTVSTTVSGGASPAPAATSASRSRAWR